MEAYAKIIRCQHYSRCIECRYKSYYPGNFILRVIVLYIFKSFCQFILQPIKTAVFFLNGIIYRQITIKNIFYDDETIGVHWIYLQDILHEDRIKSRECISKIC